MTAGITIERSHVEHRATVYEVTVIKDLVDNQIILLVADSTSLYYGEWLRLPYDLVAGGGISWNYLTEKMPGLAKYEGDKDGWIMAFGQAGLQVFR